jgi:hypothetical protein
MKKDLKVRFENRGGFGGRGQVEVVTSSFIVTELPGGKTRCVVVSDGNAQFHEQSSILLRSDVPISTINWSDTPDREQLEAAVRQALMMVSS